MSIKKLAFLAGLALAACTRPVEKTKTLHIEPSGYSCTAQVEEGRFMKGMQSLYCGLEVERNRVPGPTGELSIDDLCLTDDSSLFGRVREDMWLDLDAASHNCQLDDFIEEQALCETDDVTWSRNGIYAFPVAADARRLMWTQYHWDGSNAVDIHTPAFMPNVPLIAVTDGQLIDGDNPAGGNAAWIEGNDGNRYYYGHMSYQCRQPGPVDAGDVIGIMGNTGTHTRLIDRHLHFSAHSGPQSRYQPDINAARFLQEHFGFMWHTFIDTSYSYDTPSSWPMQGDITRTFAQNYADHPQIGSIDIRGDYQDIIAPMSGKVNVMPNNTLGMRVQITNEHSGYTVIVSGLEQVEVGEFETVSKGEILGKASDINYMTYAPDGSLIDPMLP